MIAREESNQITGVYETWFGYCHGPSHSKAQKTTRDNCSVLKHTNRDSCINHCLSDSFVIAQLTTLLSRPFSFHCAGMAEVKQEEVKREGGNAHPNPLNPSADLDSSMPDAVDTEVHPQQVLLAEDSAVSKAEKYERHGITDGVEETPSKRRKVKSSVDGEDQAVTKSERRKGVASIKAESEFLLIMSES